MTIRFEVTQPGGARHEVELPGTVAVIGRDPTCDVVLSDAKCSRRHAVVEERPDGLFIRDSGSANGVYVNGQKRHHAPLSPGDRVRLGEVELTVLPVSAETLVMAPPDVDALGLDPPSATPPARPRSLQAPAPPEPVLADHPPTRRPQAGGRPPTVTLLSFLWGLAAPLWVGGGLALAFAGELHGAGAAAAALVGLLLGAGSGAMAFGLAGRVPWARTVQMATAAAGLFVCPFAFASLTVLLYMLRPDVRTAFGPGDGVGTGPGAGDAETTFSWSLVGMLALGAVLTAALVRWLTGA